MLRHVCASAAAAALALTLLGAAAAGNVASFADPAGDSGSAPDLVAVRAAASNAGLLTVTATLAAGAVVPADAHFSLLVDRDASRVTGHGDGIDLTFDLGGGGTLSAARWQASQFVPYASRAAGMLSGTTVRWTVPLRELGLPKKLAFSVVSFAADGSLDAAPDGGFSPPPGTRHYGFQPKLPKRP